MKIISDDIQSEQSRRLIEWAVASGRFFQSKQTGFVHLFPGEENHAQTIPLLENALFVLALLRSRLVEQIQEAKKILKSLLAFQNQQADIQEGNFPVYLHEYPHCQDPAMGLKLLAPFYWILTQFGHILGTDLKNSLEKGVRLALTQAIQRHQTIPFPYSLSVRLASAQLAFGLIWKVEDDIEKGRAQLEDLSHRQLDGWNSTRHLADILVGLQMVYANLSQSLWSSLWDRMEETWHPTLNSYMGPCIREWEEKEEPEVTLYDYFGGYYAGQFSRRASLINPHQLHAILIQSSTDKFKEKRPSGEISGSLNQQNWFLFYRSDNACTLLEKKNDYPITIDKTHTSFRYIWGDTHRLHTLVCQGGNTDRIEYFIEESTIILLFDLKENSSEEENPSKRVIEFFIDFHPEFQFQCDGHSTNVFELGQMIQLKLGKRTLFLTFDLIEGEGQFLGHIMRGNRPAQLEKREKKFQAFDWTIFLRQIRSQGHVRFRVKITFKDDYPFVLP